jgi:hypothetical protein
MRNPTRFENSWKDGQSREMLLGVVGKYEFGRGWLNNRRCKRILCFQRSTKC